MVGICVVVVGTQVVVVVVVVVTVGTAVVVTGSVVVTVGVTVDDTPLKVGMERAMCNNSSRKLQ